MPYTYDTGNGRRGIDSVATFVAALSSRKVLQLNSFDDVFDQAEQLVRAEHNSVDQNALSNVRGNWYEWLLSIGTLEFIDANPLANYLLPLPNVRQYDCSKLYIDNLHAYIDDLRLKVFNATQARLITSNPDFVIVDRSLSINLPDLSSNIDSDTIQDIDHLYSQISGKCSFEHIKGYASVKVSLRPDRRLQIPHEGSLMKALYRHIQTREWIIDAPGIKYYAITTNHTAADTEGLRTIATHSITDVNARPEAAVDNLLKVSSGQELEAALRTILV